MDQRQWLRQCLEETPQTAAMCSEALCADRYLGDFSSLGAPPGGRTTLRDIVRMVVDLVDEEICPDWVEYTSQAVSDGTAPSMFSNSDVAEHFLGLRASIVIALVHTYACSGVTAADYTAGFSNPHFHIGIARNHRIARRCEKQ